MKQSYKYQVYLLLAACLTFCIYSSALLIVEWNSSQAVVRPYYSDILTHVEQPRLFAINTTLSVFLMGATSLCFLFALSFADGDTNKRNLLFYLSQALFFAYLGFDDRFQIHELLGHRFDVGDHYLLLVEVT